MCPTPTTRSRSLPDLAVAREIAEKRKAKQQEAALCQAHAAHAWRRLTEAKIAELKVILKADFRGSIEAIRKELEKLQHEEVRVRVLRSRHRRASPKTTSGWP